jgi:hypothetical protein
MAAGTQTLKRTPLHERHVAAEHQLHQHPAASDGSAKAPD